MMQIRVNNKIHVEWDGKKSKCKGCGQDIGWGVTPLLKKMPFDFDASHTAHWATCGKADEFKEINKNKIRKASLSISSIIKDLMDMNEIPDKKVLKAIKDLNKTRNEMLEDNE